MFVYGGNGDKDKNTKFVYYMDANQTVCNGSNFHLGNQKKRKTKDDF